MRKINCKHNLEPKEEIQARRLKQKILEGDNVAVKERLETLHKSYGLKITGSFYNYIKENDIVLYSALERVGGISQMYYFMEEFGLF